MNKRDIAGYLGINRATLYNWEKNRPNLYKVVMLGLMVDELIDENQKNLKKLKDIRESFKIKKELTFGSIKFNFHTPFESNIFC